jgi:phenylalanyl-tRNA synthetase beta chain
VPAALAELDLEILLRNQPRNFKIESLSRFPAIHRDLALLMPLTVKVGDVLREIRKEAGPHLMKLDVFDVYQGESLEMGQKSVAFSLVYQDHKDTLRDEVVSESIDRVLAHLKAKMQISVR